MRAAVEARAGHACEYCRLPQQGQVARFPIDHILPRSSGGQTDLQNLALACPHCNAHKWVHAHGIDPHTGERFSLFNPRSDRWSDHFQWSTQPPYQIEGTTACGRATVDRLRMNDSNVLEVRRLLWELGIFAERTAWPTSDG